MPWVRTVRGVPRATKRGRIAGNDRLCEARRTQILPATFAKMTMQSRARDEELRGLMTFGLEARDVLRDEMHRRFEAADAKYDEQFTLLKDAVRHLNSL